MYTILKTLFGALLITMTVITETNAENTGSVFIEASKNNNYQRISANVIIDRLNKADIHVTSNDKLSASDQHYDVGVILGQHEESISTTLNADALLNIITSRHEASIKASDKSHRLAYLNIDQPVCRQLELITKLSSRWKNIGLLLHKSNQSKLPDLKTCGRLHKLNIVVVNVEEYASLTEATETVLNRSDVLLALPDAGIYNRRTVKNILLSAYRHRIPVIGYSDNFVKAGALAAVYTSPEQVGEQAASIITDYFSSGHEFDRQIYSPEHFEISINTHVSRSLDLDLPDKETILNALSHGGQHQ